MKRKTMGKHLLSGAALTCLLVLSSGSYAQEKSGSVVLAPLDEPGERLIITGTVYGPDGVTPAAGVTLTLHQTDAEGYYSRPGSDESGPRLRGSVHTDEQGKYEIRTIKPGSYPRRRNPAHIHCKVTGGGFRDQWIRDFQFDGDPHLRTSDYEKNAGKGRFSAIMKPVKGPDGILRSVRDIRLEK